MSTFVERLQPGMEWRVGDRVYALARARTSLIFSVHRLLPDVPGLLQLIKFETLPEKDLAMSGNDYTKTLPTSALDRVIGPITGEDIPPEERGPSSLKPDAIAAVAAVQNASLSAAERAIRLSNRNHNSRLAKVKEACQAFYKATGVKVTLAATEVWLPCPLPSPEVQEGFHQMFADKVPHQHFIDTLDQYTQLYLRLREHV